MAFCGKCGAQVNEGAKVCPGCGAAQANSAPDLSAKIQGLNNTADTTAAFDQQDIANNKVMGVLAYLSWLVLIPIFGAKDSKFARFHANQGLALAITEIAWWIIEAILGSVLLSLLRYSFSIYSIIMLVLNLVNIVFLVLAILGIVNALNGRAKELPIVGKFKILK